MRSQSEQVRLIIANLYIRVRIARANASVANTIYGMGSLKAEALKGALSEAKDALSHAIISTQSADRPGARLLVEIARRSAEARNAALGSLLRAA